VEDEFKIAVIILFLVYTLFNWSIKFNAQMQVAYCDQKQFFTLIRVQIFNKHKTEYRNINIIIIY
jgi:hypothetical protein